MKHVSIDKLNEHLFESIEMLRNGQDPKADECEKMDVETAKAIADLGKVVIDGYKVKAQVLQMLSKADNPNATGNAAVASGILDDDTKAIG